MRAAQLSLRIFAILVICTICAFAEDAAVPDYSDKDRFISGLKAAVGDALDSEVAIASAKEVRGDEPDFHCDTHTPGPEPTSVHRLQAGDIKVVAAMGDSITAAFAAKATSILNIFTEYRGVSWSVGYDEELKDLVTLPNILQQFDPNIVGGSTGTGGANSNNAHLNVAITGAIAEGMPAQARTLIQRMKDDPEVDFENDWKVVTLWIGGNDLCAICNGKEKNTPENYAKYIGEALDILHAEMPRTFVNLVLIIDVTKLYPVRDGACVLLHSFVCKCGTQESQEKRDEVTAAAHQYQQLTQALCDSGKYDTRDDFTVVCQPFFQDTDVPEKEDGTPDRSYFAIDCFHFNLKSMQAAAVALFNNMIEPVGHKRTSWSPGESFECPSKEFPYLFTNKNSQEYLDMMAAKGQPVSSGNSVSRLGFTPAGTNSNGSQDTPIALIVGAMVGGVAVLSVVGALIWRHRRTTRAGYAPLE